MKQLIIKLDRILLNGAIRRFIYDIKFRKTRLFIHALNRHRIEIFYSKNEKCNLAKLCDVYGSDKGELSSDGNPYNWSSHTYTDFYEMIFGHCRNKVKKVLECGIGKNSPLITSSMGVIDKSGASLRVWRDYFHNAEVIGIDIDKDILFSEDRIRTYEVDQTSALSIQKFWNSISWGDIDIILDDGLHEYHAGICLFENCIEHLASDGVYIIEDVGRHDLTKYASYFESVSERYMCRFVSLYLPLIPVWNNSVLMITKK